MATTTTTTTPSQITRLIYAKDSRGHRDLAYPYPVTAETGKNLAPINRLTYAKDSRGHTDLTYPYYPESDVEQQEGEDEDEETTNLSSSASSSISTTSKNSSIYTGPDGGFRAIYEKSQSGNLLKAALSTRSGNRKRWL